MQPNERVSAVYQRQTPDQVPLILDLSHWYKKNMNLPFNLAGMSEVDHGLVDLHKKVGAVAYVEMGSFYRLKSDNPDYQVSSTTEDGIFKTAITTPDGTLYENINSCIYGRNMQ